MEIESIVLTLFPSFFYHWCFFECDYSRPVPPPHVSPPLADCVSQSPFPDNIHPLVGETNTSGILVKTCSGAHPVRVLTWAPRWSALCDVTPRLSSSGMLNVLTRNNTLTSWESSTKYQEEERRGGYWEIVVTRWNSVCVWVCKRACIRGFTR